VFAGTRRPFWMRPGQLASQISSCAPLTVQGVKEVINYSRDYGVHAGLDYVVT